MTMIKLRFIPILLIPLASCGADRWPEPDSAPVNGPEPVLDEHPGGAILQEARSLTQEPLLSLGAAGGSPEFQFQDVRGAVRLSDGTIIVADRGAQELRWYDEKGAHLHTVGGQGEGPGEFQGLVYLFVDGDTLVTFDGRLQRVSIFSSSGIFTRSFQLPTLPGLVQGVFGDGSFLLADVMNEGAQISEGFQRPMRGTYHLDAEGTILEALPSFPDREETVRVLGGNGGRGAITAMPPVFGKETVFAVHRDHFAVSDQTRPEVKLYRSNGAPLSSLPWPDTDRAVTEETLDLHREYQLSRADGPDARRAIDRNLREEIYPDSLPSHGRILFDPQGNLWVETYQLPGQGAVLWRVLDPKGNLVDSVFVPERFHVFEVGVDYVLGKWWDEWDVEHILLYGLVGPGGPP